MAAVATSWTVLIYRVPTEPASGRVSIWRDLKQMGALYLQQCACILPAREDLTPKVTRVIGKIADLGGEHWLLAIPTVPEADEARLTSSFRELRNKEYAEIIEECETKFVKEIEFEHFRKNYSFEEAEEIGQDLEKIRRWFRRVTERDWFDADRRPEVEAWIDRCAEMLAQFEEVVYRQAGDDFAPATPPLAIPNLAPDEPDAKTEEIQ
ncbi:MAG TPA: Chromate resistance protein ChrB [Thermomicrobiales bacterium]|nr:Chromate resistance protein ChrB [Thermomicrobiales bacterium]